MEIYSKPVCEYGSNCYRKNPNHFKEYSHPRDTMKEEKKKRTDEKQQANKKPKLDIVKEPAKRPMLDIVKEPAVMKKESPQSEKKNTPKVQDTKKMKQTTLNFFTKTDDKKKSPEADKKIPTRTSPRKQAPKDDENKKLKTSPRRDEIAKRKTESPEKIKRNTEKTSPKKIIANLDYISDSEEEIPSKSPVLSKKIDKVSKLRMSPEKTEMKKIRTPSPKKIVKKKSPKKTGAVHYLSDSDEEMFTELVETFENKEKANSEKTEQAEKINKEPEPDSSKKTVIEESDVEEDEEEEKKEEPPKTTSWTYIKKAPEESKEKISRKNESDSTEDIIKNLFLVNMPQDFYNFFEFCKHLDSSQPLKALQVCGLKLVGPFDVLAGNKQLIEKENAVCHWRYYYDPPEFQTVLSGEKGFHMGYWRDHPKEPPVFVASNNSHDCTFKIEAENIFGALHSYLKGYIKTCDPFVKLKIPKLQNSLNKWAEEHNITLEKTTDAMRRRQKSVLTKTLHKVGMVVPYDPKTELGYRPLIETEANLKKICKLIMDSSDQRERDALWDNLQPLITAANIANDECDFGNGLELGIDLFCLGSPVFHDTIEHLLTTSYSLLRRSEFGEIIKSHLKNRKKGTYLSIV